MGFYLPPKLLRVTARLLILTNALTYPTTPPITKTAKKIEKGGLYFKLLASKIECPTQGTRKAGTFFVF